MNLFNRKKRHKYKTDMFEKLSSLEHKAYEYKLDNSRRLIREFLEEMDSKSIVFSHERTNLLEKRLFHLESDIKYISDSNLYDNLISIKKLLFDKNFVVDDLDIQLEEINQQESRLQIRLKDLYRKLSNISELKEKALKDNDKYSYKKLNMLEKQYKAQTQILDKLYTSINQQLTSINISKTAASTKQAYEILNASSISEIIKSHDINMDSIDIQAESIGDQYNQILSRTDESNAQDEFESFEKAREAYLLSKVDEDDSNESQKERNEVKE